MFGPPQPVRAHLGLIVHFHMVFAVHLLRAVASIILAHGHCQG